MSNRLAVQSQVFYARHKKNVHIYEKTVLNVIIFKLPLANQGSVYFYQYVYNVALVYDILYTLYERMIFLLKCY